jgi:feruloyl esterase
MEAQRYPSDYDGIVAGAPANYWTHLFANAVWNLQALLIDPKSYIPPAKLPAIQAAALTACDASDGVKDGAIENPRQCRFDPAVLECKGDDADTCLTMPQVAALKKLYAGSVFPGYPPGGEAEPGGWEPWITGAAPEKSLMFAFGTQFFKNMVFANPSWDFRTFDKDRDTKLTDTKMGPILNAIDPDLSRFRARGGKLILYHGWSDAAIAAGNAIDYYESVQAKMGANQARGFVRLFMVPAMQHCNGGSGASNFGQFSLGSTDAEHNINAALERWVEMGVAPEQVIGTSARSRTRPICAYPLIARYKGTGSTDDAANFTCSQP